MTLWSTLWTFTRPHRQFLANFLLPVALSLLLCAAAGGWLAEHDQRVKNEAAHARAMRLADGAIAKWAGAYADVVERQRQDGTTVTVTREHYQTIRDTIWKDLDDAHRVHSDTPKLLKDLPVFIRSSDDAVARCTAYQVSCEARGHIADSLIAALDAKVQLLERAAPWKPPRWTVEGELLYDPIAVAPATSGAVTLRIAGHVSAVARVEQRFAPGERPRAYLGLRITR